METPTEDRDKFDHVTRLISSTVDELSRHGCLSLDVIEQVQIIIFNISCNCTCRVNSTVILMNVFLITW